MNKLSQIFGCDNIEYQEILCVLLKTKWCILSVFDRQQIIGISVWSMISLECVSSNFTQKNYFKIKRKKNENMFKMQQSRQKRKNKKIDRIRSFPFFKSSLNATTSNEPTQHMREVKQNANKFRLKPLNGSLFEYFCSLNAHFQGYDL